MASKQLLSQVLSDPSTYGDDGFLRSKLSDSMTGPDVKVFATNNVIAGAENPFTLRGIPLGDKLEKMIDPMGEVFKDKADLNRDLRLVGSIGFGQTHYINPPFQFNNNDDVRPSNPELKVRSAVGRVYNDYVRSNFPILAIEPGRQVFNKNILGLLGVGDDKSVYREGASYLKGERSIDIGAPFEFLRNSVQNTIGFLTGNGISASKFADFVNDIGRYSDFFDSMIIEIAAYMGLISSKDVAAADTSLAVGVNNDSAEAQKALDARQKAIAELDAAIKAAQDKASGASNGRGSSLSSGPTKSELEVLNERRQKLLDNAPEVKASGEKEKNGILDMFKPRGDNVLKAKTSRDAGAKYSFMGFTGQQLNLFSILANRGSDGKFSGIAASAFKSTDVNFLQFIIQNDVTVSETFSNNIGEHPLASSVNSSSQEAQRQNEGGGVTTMITPSNAKEVLQKFAAGALKNVAVDAGLGGELGYAMAGNTRLQLPNVWEDSTYSRSYSMTFTLFSPYGDDLSIFENVMTPLTMLLCLALPMKAGKQSYISPFVVRIHCPGVVSVDYGIVESLTITRGDEKNDFTHGRTVPRTVKVNMTVRDMMPNFLMSFDGGVFSILNATNTGFRNYLMNICGLGLADKRNLGERWDRFLKVLPNSIDSWFTKTVGLDFVSNTGFSKFISTLVRPITGEVDNSDKTESERRSMGLTFYE